MPEELLNLAVRHALVVQIRGDHILMRKRTDLAASARLLALLNVAEADAAIVSWDAKYATRPGPR